MAGEHFSAQKRVTWIPESFSEMFHCGTSNFLRILTWGHVTTDVLFDLI